MKKLINCKSKIEYIDRVVREILNLMKSKRGTFRLAVSGGRSPHEIYSKLAQSNEIDWNEVEVYLVDERYVPLSDSLSNAKAVRQSLFNDNNIRPSKWVFFNTNLSISDCLEEYKKKLPVNGGDFFDLVILGLGSDGHTASLFPNGPELNETNEFVTHSTTEENPVFDRVTLTYKALESSRNIFFLVSGSEKEDILEKLKNSNAESKEIPAAKLFNLKQARLYYSPER